MINLRRFLLSFHLLLISCSVPAQTIEKDLRDNDSLSTKEIISKNKNNLTYQNQSVKLGIDVLNDRKFDILKGKKIGLITNQTGVDRNLRLTLDLLNNSSEVELVSIFAPEHGVRGDIEGGEYIESYIDSLTGLPVYSLYGKTRRPTQKMLDGLDAIVYDIQDIGLRSYTFISSLGLAMESASDNNLEFIVLDRPNPLGGIKIEGNIAEEKFKSFIGQYPIPYVYGLTCGELAKLIVGENYISTNSEFNLTVVPMQNWKREMNWEETGLKWVPTSPHIPYSFSSYYCAMTGILGELRSAVSVGVGYTLPFQIIGAEWINGTLLSIKLNQMDIPGVFFKPITYKPYYAYGQGKRLEGVQIYIENFDEVNLLKTQFFILWALKNLYPSTNLFKKAKDNEIRMFNKGIGTDYVLKSYENDFNFEELEKFLDKDVEKFKETSEKYYLYN